MNAQLLGCAATSPVSLTEANTRHARLRLEERYGLLLTMEQFAQLTNRIRKPHKYPGQAVLIRGQAKGREWWRVQFDGRSIVAVYRPRCGLIITVLEPAFLHDPTQIRSGLRKKRSA